MTLIGNIASINDAVLTGNIAGIKGDTGVGIASITENDDYTITIALTDGSTFTTEPIAGFTSIVVNDSGNLVVTKTDGTTVTLDIGLSGYKTAIEGYKNDAQTSAGTATTQALRAEGNAVGKQNGTDVTSDSEYYHNNAKYYSQQASSSASSASTSETNAAASETAVSGVKTQLQNRMGAIETEQRAQDARMDSFVTLAEGSTTGDAELADIRVGANGKTYPNAGDAVRGQVSVLKSDLDNIRIIGEPLNPTYVSGYITTSGTIGNGETRTNFIKLSGQYVTIIPKESQSRIAEYSGTTAGTFTKFIAKDRITSPITFAPDPNKYYVMDLFTAGGGSYTPETCPVDALTIISIDNTDTSLSLSGKSADAKAVGDRFLEEAQKSINNIRSQQRSTILFDMQSGHGFYNPLGAGNAPSDDTSNFIFGSQSVNFNYAGKSSFIPTDLSEAIITVTLKINSIDSNATINMYITDDNTLTNYSLSSLYKNVPANQFEIGVWATVAVSIEASRIVGTPNLANAKYIQFSVSGGTADYNIQSIGYRNKGEQKPCISFTFDDGWSEVMLGAKILGKYNIPATAYIFTGCELTTNQLLSLKNDYGWDIELHGDSVFTEMTSEALAAYIQEQQSYVKSNGLGDGQHMAYPGGQNNRDVVNVVKRFCKTARTINSDAQSIETIPSPMPYNLRSVSGIGASGTSVAIVKETINKAVACNGWAILVFHRIGDTATSMFCSEADLETIAQYAVASGADIKTVSDMWERD